MANNLREAVIDVLHQTHPGPWGMAKMAGHLWWPFINKAKDDPALVSAIISTSCLRHSGYSIHAWNQTKRYKSTSVSRFEMAKEEKYNSLLASISSKFPTLTARMTLRKSRAKFRRNFE